MTEGNELFEFATASRIVFGENSSQKLPSMAAAMGDRALVVTGCRPERAMRICRSADNLQWHFYSLCTGEPDIDDILNGVETGRRHNCDVVIGFGGGGAMDAAKAIAALLTNNDDIADYLEVIGKAMPLRNPPIPCIAVPTTAGTGSEVTRNAVIKSNQHRVKVSLRSPMMLPSLALVDPVLTMSMPGDVTASTGLDALTQLIEAYTTRHHNPITDALCETGIRAAGRSLLHAYEDGSDREARRDMCLASLLSGLALANAGLGAVHGFAGPIGGLFDAPHGMVCAALLPAVFEANLASMTSESERSRYDQIGRFLVNTPDANADDALQWIHHTRKTLQVAPLGALGISLNDIPIIVEKARNAGSMKGNPVLLSDAALSRIVQQSM